MPYSDVTLRHLLRTFEISNSGMTRTRGEIEVAVSQTIIAEIHRVTGYERLQKKYKRIREEREGLIDDLRNFATMVEPEQKLSVIQADESHNRYIECAVESGASYIVTGDPHLLAARECQGIVIVTPATFLALLDTVV